MRFLQCRICNLHAPLAAGLSLLLLQLLLRLLLPLWLVSACEGLLLLNQSDLDVAGGGHVRVDPSVGPVGSPPHLGGAVHLDVLNDQVIGMMFSMCIRNPDAVTVLTGPFLYLILNTCG